MMKYEVTREEMVKEAEERMKMLRIMDNVVQEFVKDGILNCSEHCGILFYLDDEEKDIVAKFQEENGGLVYHIIKDYTEYGTILTLLFISKYKEEWEDDKKQLKHNGFTFAYVENLDFPLYSELGGVVVMPRFGGVKRIV